MRLVAVGRSSGLWKLRNVFWDLKNGIGENGKRGAVNSRASLYIVVGFRPVALVVKVFS